MCSYYLFHYVIVSVLFCAFVNVDHVHVHTNWFYAMNQAAETTVHTTVG